MSDQCSLRSPTNKKIMKRQVIKTLCNSKRFMSLDASKSPLDNAFTAASEYFSQEKQVLIDQLNTETDPIKKVSIQVKLGLSDPKKHASFIKTKVDLKDPIFAEMHQNRFKNEIAPKLIKCSHQLKIVGDVLPEVIQPKINLEINFENTNWLSAHGHPVPPNWALYSPKFAISTNEDRIRYFTLLMMDIDHPNEKKGCYEEWCHWLVANIPVNYRLEVAGGSSPFLAPGKGSKDSGAHFIPETPKTPPIIPGETLLDYIPPHPPLSNPRKVHRYLFTLLESKTPGEKIDVAGIKALLDVSEDDSPRKELSSNARSCLGTTYKFINDFGLQVQGYGLITSIWNLYTSDIFTRLNIHEPVYGTLAGQKNQYEILKSLNTAREIATQISTPLSELSAQELMNLNTASRASNFSPMLMTKERLELESMISKSEQIKKKRMHRLTVTGATGLVRSRENIQDMGRIKSDQPKIVKDI